MIADQIICINLGDPISDHRSLIQSLFIYMKWEHDLLANSPNLQSGDKGAKTEAQEMSGIWSTEILDTRTRQPYFNIHHIMDVRDITCSSLISNLKCEIEESFDSLNSLRVMKFCYLFFPASCFSNLLTKNPIILPFLVLCSCFTHSFNQLSK